MTTWHDVIGEEKEKEYFKKVRLFEREERSRHQVFPKAENVFKALELTPFDQVKVVILGQDPYHGDHQAHGLSFSVQQGVVPFVTKSSTNTPIYASLRPRINGSSPRILRTALIPA